MRKYSVDVGTYERGRTMEVEARTPDEAYQHGLTSITGSDIEKYGEDCCIVQIYEIIGDKRKCVFDYMNGFGIYRSM